MTQIQNNAVTTSVCCIDPVKEFLVLLENPRVQAFFDKMVETKVHECLLTSESAKNAIEETVLNSDKFKPAVIDVLLTEDAGQLPQRVKALEKLTGIYEFEEFEDHKPTIPEKINVLAEQVSEIKSNPQACKPLEMKDFVPENPTDLRLLDVVKHVFNFKKDVLTGKELDKVLLKSIEAEKKPKKLSNLRMAKKCLLSRAEEVFPFFKIGKSKYGNHRLRLLVTDKKALSDYAIKHGMLKCQKA